MPSPRARPPLRAPRAATTLALAVLFACAPAASAESAEPAADLSSFDWLAGCWSGSDGETRSEEHWTTSEGGGLVGMHKDVRRGVMSGFEFLRIVTVAGEGICYVSSPNAAPPTPFCLVERGERRAVFENRGHDFPQRVLYWREGERLHARVEGTVVGVLRGEEWSWERCR